MTEKEFKGKLRECQRAGMDIIEAIHYFENHADLGVRTYLESRNLTIGEYENIMNGGEKEDDPGTVKLNE